MHFGCRLRALSSGENLRLGELGVCVECLAGEDTCADGLYCGEDNECAVGCSDDEDCPLLEGCDTETHQCTGCSDDNDCPVGTACEGTCVSCSDGIQNQDEEGIDCGGVCPPCGLGCNGGNSTVLSQDVEYDLVAGNCYSFDKQETTLQLGTWSQPDTTFDIEDSVGTLFSQSVTTDGWTPVSGVANNVGYFKVTVSVRAKWNAW
jgi:hypothetical protein